MPFAYRLRSCGLLLVLACNKGGGAGTDTDATDATATEPPVTTTTTTTGGPTTDGTATTPTTTDGTTTTTESATTGAPVQCSIYTDESACGQNGCEWAQILSYTHGTQGCLGDIHDFCVPKETSGGLTSVWRDIDGDIEVLQFTHTPTDLGPEWSVCDCDGPLACLCTAQTLDCPERMDEFCGLIGNDTSCTNAASGGNLVCGWFNVSKEGPPDPSCDDSPSEDRCLPGTNLGTNDCPKLALPYPNVCQGEQNPIFWREVDGVVEVINVCGPEPIGWNRCVADDPNQPEDCKCRCL
ncbi:hypothetical protein [Nannocystis sp. SCPEA4]|uniref:hypothetical protein n=1 Tax=Nannocystis sp. SCPEA4 TaxID=2996787 RepID=UPI0022706635|nr:hypothetical protein [Nannocystis sp. SCPEA4]MCY1055070.1 hypothetical protein [Nannocystis sp. SCPEA4]